MGIAGIKQFPRVFLMNGTNDSHKKRHRCQAKGLDFAMKRDGIEGRMPTLSFMVGGWSRFSSACKIFLFLQPALGVIIFFQLGAVFFTWFIALGLLLSTRPNSEWWITCFLPLAGSVAFFAIWLPWTVVGEPIWPVFWFSPSWTGVGRAFLLWLKGTTVAMGFLGLGRVCSSNEMLATFQMFKIPSVPLCVIWITIQQTKRLFADWRRTLQAHRARATPAKGAFGQTQFMASVWAQMLVRSQNRTEDLACALQARGFSRRFYFLPTINKSSNLWIFPFILFFTFFILLILEHLSK